MNNSSQVHYSMYSKRSLICLLLSFSITLVAAQSKKARKAMAKENALITANIEKHINYLADDALEGRRSGTKGEQLAMEYIETQFKANGVEAAGENGFIQPFEINEGKSYTGAGNFFKIAGREMQAGEDYFPLSFSGNGNFAANLSPSLREDGQPWFFDVNEWLEENHTNPHFDIIDAIYKEAIKTIAKKSTALLLYNSGGFTDNVLFNKYDTTKALDIPVIFISKTGMKKFIPDISEYHELELSVSINTQKRVAHNVVGYINNNAEHTVILGAHFDHLGYGEDGNSLDGAGAIHNGADDNASGTAALIELGRLLKKSAAKNNNYLLLAFSGEELGLLGSKYWVSSPSYKVKPNYMINMDMVGRYEDSRKLTIGGYGTSPYWSGLLSSIQTNNLQIKYDSSGSGPSDHASFYRGNIPVLFFFTNSHSDYHKATDDADKINFLAETRIINLIADIIKAADSKGTFPFLQTKDAEVRSVKLPVTLGVMPDYGFTGTGMRIEGVSKGKTAERIGLQTGDILLQIGEYKFVDVPSYMSALQHFHKGDSTTLRIQRNGTEMVFDVTF